MFYILKYIFIVVVSNLMKIFWLLPIRKNVAVFTSFGGKQVSCNPFYIYSYLKQWNTELKLYWIVTESTDARTVPDEEKVLKGSFNYFLILMTARYIITNDRIPSYFLFRKKQALINTWHGGGAFKKTFGINHGIEKWYLNKMNAWDADRTSYYLSTSDIFSNLLRNSFNYKKTILPIGYPRNDIFFKKSNELTSKIKGNLCIPTDVSVILYAPTYRGCASTSSPTIIQKAPIDVTGIIGIWKRKYGKECVFLFRGHHTMRKGLVMDNTIDVSNYPDMQEILLIADMLITDYSSCMWDYALTHKECHIYAPDFDEYINERGFESDYKQWPFIISKTNDDLIKKIENFSQESYNKAVKKYLYAYGSYEKGNAAQLFAERLKEM